MQSYVYIYIFIYLYMHTYIYIYLYIYFIYVYIAKTMKNVDSEYKLVTGWRRLIGCPKLQIIFHKGATKYRSLLPKMTYKDKGSCESSPPCNSLYKSSCIRINDQIVSRYKNVDL